MRCGLSKSGFPPPGRGDGVRAGSRHHRNVLDTVTSPVVEFCSIDLRLRDTGTAVGWGERVCTEQSIGRRLAGV